MLYRIILLGLACVLAFCCFRIAAMEMQKAELKRDEVELSHIKYGLFNVDEWKKVIAGIITKKVREFEINDENREEMHRKVEELLTRVIDEVERVMQEESTNSISGFFQQFAMDLFGSMDKVRRGIPQYADQVIEYLNDPTNREELKNYLIKRFNEMADKTVGQVDYSEYNGILAKYAVLDKEMGLVNIAYQREQLRRTEAWYFVLLTLTCIGMAAMIRGAQNYSSLELGVVIASASALLIAGLSLPMIDIEATISSFSFKLVGEPVEFKDQVLFFQSKSILQVVGILIKNGGFGLVLVALLVFTFSVLIPLAKIIGSTVTIVRQQAPQHWLHRFLVYKSGKWSMADVMVVAIFMSYIGFNGVINNQLTQITAFSSNVQVFTTNNSTLQTGFYLFASYCLIGLLLSVVIEKKLQKVTT